MGKTWVVMSAGVGGDRSGDCVDEIAMLIEKLLTEVALLGPI